MYDYCIVFTYGRPAFHITASDYNLGPRWIQFSNVAGEIIFRVTASAVLFIERSDIAS